MGDKLFFELSELYPTLYIALWFLLHVCTVTRNDFTHFPIRIPSLQTLLKQISSNEFTSGNVYPDFKYPLQLRLHFKIRSRISNINFGYFDVPQ